MAFWNKKRSTDEPDLGAVSADNAILTNEIVSAESLSELTKKDWMVKSPFDEMIWKFEHGQDLVLPDFQKDKYEVFDLPTTDYIKPNEILLTLSEGAVEIQTGRFFGADYYYTLSVTYEPLIREWTAILSVAEDLDHNEKISSEDQNVEKSLEVLQENGLMPEQIKSEFSQQIVDDVLATYFANNESKFSLENLGDYIEIEKIQLA